MRRKIDIEVGTAAKHAESWINSIPDSLVKRRRNAERISTICQDLVEARPTQDPTSSRVAESGGVRYGDFPKPQTLLNSYSPLLKIWRDAYQRVLDISAPIPHLPGEAPEIDDREMIEIDSGLRARINLLVQLNKEQLATINRLKNIISESVPAPRPGTEGIAVDDCSLEKATLSRWLSDLESGNGPLIATDLGIKLTQRAHPQALVASDEVLEALRMLILD